MAEEEFFEITARGVRFPAGAVVDVTEATVLDGAGRPLWTRVDVTVAVPPARAEE